MKENEDKYMDELVNKVMKHSTLETPALDFTSVIMKRVEAIESSTSTTYEPLISKRAWFVMFSAFIGFVVFVIWLGNPEVSGWFDTVNFNYLNVSKFLKIFKGIRLSTMTSNSILMFAVMLLIQVPLLKHYYDKRVLN